MALRVLESSSSIAARLERTHRAEGDAGTVRLVRGEPSPPFRGSRPILLRFAPGGQLLEAPCISPSHPVALYFGPALEFGRVRDEEAIEKRAAIECCRLSE